MSESVSTNDGGAVGSRPPGLLFAVASAIIGLLGLMPWLLAAMFAPALLGAPGPSPSPLTILGVAAVLSYPLWLLYWAARVIAERRAGAPGRLQAAAMAAPALLLLGVFSFFNTAP